MSQTCDAPTTSAYLPNAPIVLDESAGTTPAEMLRS